MKLPFKSVRWRLLFWHSLLSIALVLAICLLAYKLVSREQFDRIDHDLGKHERNFFHGVFPKKNEVEKGTPPSSEHFKSTLRDLNNSEPMPSQVDSLLESESEKFFMAIWDDEDGAALFISDHAPQGISLPTKIGENSRTTVDQEHFRMLVQHHPAGAVVVVGRDISDELASLQQFRIILAVSGVGILTVAILGSWWLAGRALKPIQTISETASRIAEGNLRERISISRSDNELGRLGQVLNTTFERLASSIDRQKNFTSDASHELRTPLTIILSESQRGMRNERPVEQYKEILGHCNIAAKRMRGIIESLLLLARQDQNEPHETEAMDLAETAENIAQLLQAEVENNSHRIIKELDAAPISANRELLLVLIRNLIANAICHCPTGTEITLRSYTDDIHSVLEVHDNGPGIPADYLPHLFERFYRLDEARTQSHGHSGLGLAIAKTIVEGHGGRIEVSSTAETGTTFRVELPMLEE